MTDLNNITGRVIMTAKVNREIIADGVAFTEIVDKKFKTDLIRIKFITELNEKSTPLNTMVSMLLSSTNSKLREYSKMTDALNSLYGAEIYSETAKSGDCQIITFSANCINNVYSFDGEDILGKLLDITEDCIFSPNIENGEFNKKEFELKKRDLKETIIAEINNKRSYAMQRAGEVIYKNEPFACSFYGTVENADKITAKELADAYYKLIETSEIEVFFVSSVSNPSVKARFASAFSKVERKFKKTEVRSLSLLKAEPVRKEETIEASQTKAVIAYKSDIDDNNACLVMSRLFGGTPFSLLFSNVREKMSLCYYCSGSYIYTKGVLFVSSGVESENVEKLINAVSEQLEMIKRGEISDELIENTKLYLVNNFKSVPDSPGSLVAWYFDTYRFGEPEELSERMDNIMNVSRERIIAAARSFKPDTVYIMKAENSEGGECDDE